MSDIIFIKKKHWYSIEAKNIQKIKNKEKYVHILFKEDYIPEIPDVKRHGKSTCVKIYEPNKNFRQSSIPKNIKLDKQKEEQLSSSSMEPSSVSSESLKESPKTPKTPKTPKSPKSPKSDILDFAGIIFNDSVQQKDVKSPPLSPNRKTSFLNDYDFVDGIPILKT